MGWNFWGGKTGSDFAAVLIPAGYERELFVQWGSRRYDRYKLDFAHSAAKVNIELDGPYHDRDSSPEQDAARDQRLRELGWKVIRIKHD